MRPGTLLIATTNRGKLGEITGILAGAPVALVTLEAFPGIEEPHEDGTSCAENARLKAIYYAARTGLPAAADDSGLEIEALDNAPGVQSARWHGTDYTVKLRQIHELLRERGLTTSPARFVCTVAMAIGDRVVFESVGTVEGTIAPAPRGTNGFGYDPLFFYPPCDCTLAELDAPRKAEVSHRGKAFRQLRAYLERGQPWRAAYLP